MIGWQSSAHCSPGSPDTALVLGVQDGAPRTPEGLREMLRVHERSGHSNNRKSDRKMFTSVQINSMLLRSVQFSAVCVLCFRISNRSSAHRNLLGEWCLARMSAGRASGRVFSHQICTHKMSTYSTEECSV